MTKKIVLATSNMGKVHEIQSLLPASLALDVIPQGQFNIADAEETGLTFIENALIKARHACKLTGLAAIADDSGLEVDALQGAPGIYSARYAGEPTSYQANINKLLLALAAHPELSQRQARFHSVMVYLEHALDPAPLVCHGIWTGAILNEQRGAEGFGYDPVFYVSTHQCSAAELSLQDKNALSHRGQAMRQLLQKLQERFTLSI